MCDQQSRSACQLTFERVVMEESEEWRVPGKVWAFGPGINQHARRAVSSTERATGFGGQVTGPRSGPSPSSLQTAWHNARLKLTGQACP
mmetsp:Transcript_76770/g.135575  ORF Transcript_76770/g.135575 Transcript_76770/m.135575 type:complete len:89 (+) Transcript_76770:34-300(+)